MLGDARSNEAVETASAFDVDVQAGHCRLATAAGIPEAKSALTSAEFVTFIVAGDRPSPSAIAAIADVVADHPDLDVLYGDVAIERTQAIEQDSFHKPAWSPERLLSQNYLGSMVTYRAENLAGLDMGSMVGRSSLQQLHDVALQATATATVVAHLPRIVCVEGPVHRAGRAAVEEVQRHFDRARVRATASVTTRTWAGRPIVGFVPDLGDWSPLVSIIIPTGGSSRTLRGESFVLVDNAIRSLVDVSTYQNIEIVVVVDAKSTQALADRLADMDPRVRIVKDERAFNFAAACNLGVSASSGSLVVLLNDDTEVVTPDWVERLIVMTSLDGVGAVGVKLLYGDGRVQHGGVATRDTGPDHLYHGYPGNDDGHGGWLQSIVNCFAATGACLAVQRDRWDAVEGMDEQFPLNYNDIDLCLRLQARGWRTVVDNQTELTHLETSSRPAGSETWEVEAFRERWGRWLDNDPYDNPNLVTVGLQQVPPPPALSALVEHRGGARHPARVWSRDHGFGLEVSRPLVTEH